MDASIVFPALAAILVTLAIYWRYTSGVERAYNTFEYLRKGIATLLVILVAVTFLQSGNPYLFAIALALIVFATVYVLVEQPHKTLV